VLHFLLVSHGSYDPNVQPARIALQANQYVRLYSGPGASLEGSSADEMAKLIEKNPYDTSWHSRMEGRFLFHAGYNEQYVLENSSQKRREDKAKVERDAARYPKTYNPSNGYLNLLLGPTSNKQVRNYKYLLDKDEEDLPEFTPRFVAIKKDLVNVRVQPIPSSLYSEEGTLQQLLNTCDWLAQQQPFMFHWVACTEVKNAGGKYLNYIWELK
jgi:hypothetical protein